MCKVFFANSGSEANDLALRLARTHTKHKDVICVERGYHGHTISTLAISPYKTKKIGIKNDWVHTVSCPDMFRGVHANLSEKDQAVKYSNQVRDACEKHEIGAFIVESGMSVAGVVLPPKGYLEHCYKHVRQHIDYCVYSST